MISASLFYPAVLWIKNLLLLDTGDGAETSYITPQLNYLQYPQMLEGRTGIQKAFSLFPGWTGRLFAGPVGCLTHDTIA